MITIPHPVIVSRGTSDPTSFPDTETAKDLAEHLLCRNLPGQTTDIVRCPPEIVCHQHRVKSLACRSQRMVSVFEQVALSNGRDRCAGLIGKIVQTRDKRVLQIGNAGTCLRR
ncbi:MAG: hypothetical protein AAGD40_02575, partial [Pseudomonadota bacterium]